MDFKSDPCLAGKKNEQEKELVIIKGNTASVAVLQLMKVVCFCNFRRIILRPLCHLL